MSRNFRKILLSLATPLALIATLTIANPASAAQAIRLQYRTSAPGDTTAQAEPWLQLFNNGTTTIPLNQVKIRYYLNGTETYRFACSWAVISCSTVTGHFVPQSADAQYLEIGFTAGQLAPGATTRDLQLRFYRADWQSFTQNDDPSYGPQTSYADWNKIAVYVNGAAGLGRPIGQRPRPGPRPDRPARPRRRPVRRFHVHELQRPQAGAARLDRARQLRRPRRARRHLVPVGDHLPQAACSPWTPPRTAPPRAPSTPSSPPPTASSSRARTAPACGSPTPRPAAPTASTWCRRSSPSPRCRFDLDPDYGELDFEYLPNGGWGEPSNILYTTTLGDLPGRAVAGGERAHRGARQLRRLARPGDPGRPAATSSTTSTARCSPTTAASTTPRRPSGSSSTSGSSTSRPPPAPAPTASRSTGSTTPRTRSSRPPAC